MLEVCAFPNTICPFVKCIRKTISNRMWTRAMYTNIRTIHRNSKRIQIPNAFRSFDKAKKNCYTIKMLKQCERQSFQINFNDTNEDTKCHPLVFFSCKIMKSRCNFKTIKSSKVILWWKNPIFVVDTSCTHISRRPWITHYRCIFYQTTLKFTQKCERRRRREKNIWFKHLHTKYISQYCQYWIHS